MPAANALSVLIVDDQRSMRQLVRGALQSIGCNQLQEASDGKEALEALSVRPVHLILSDMNMPNMDGMGLLQAVRDRPQTKSTAFIMLTSRGDVDLVKQAMALKVNNYIMKPFTVAALRAKIEAVFGPLT